MAHETQTVGNETHFTKKEIEKLIKILNNPDIQKLLDKADALKQ